jgi:hypothetical protein
VPTTNSQLHFVAGCAGEQAGFALLNLVWKYLQKIFPLSQEARNVWFRQWAIANERPAAASEDDV